MIKVNRKQRLKSINKDNDVIMEKVHKIFEEIIKSYLNTVNTGILAVKLILLSEQYN